MNAETNPSSDWTQQERLQLIEEYTVFAMNHQWLIHNPKVVYEIMDKIRTISIKPASFLENNREQVLSLSE